MYSIQIAYAKSNSSEGNWEVIDLGNLNCRRLFNDYQTILANFHDTFRPDRLFSLNLTDIIEQFTTFDGTFDEWLNSRGNKSLPLKDGYFTIDKGVIEYEDCIRAGYKLYPIGDTEALDAEIPRIQKTNILMKHHEKSKGKELSFYKGAYESLLVSVGGYFHLTDYDKNGIYIVDGMRTLNKHPSGTPLIGLTSFADVGKLKFIPITDEMIYLQDEESTLYERTFIKLPMNIDNKTFMISIGGHLHVMDWLTCRRTGKNAISIDFKNMPLLERIYESMRYLDFKHLDINYGYNPEHMDPNEIMSNEFIRKYLTMSQSFIIIVEHADVYIKRLHVQNTKLPYQYISHIFPNYPMFNGIGKVSEYWSIYDEGKWEVNSFENFHHQRLFRKNDYWDEYAVTATRTSGMRTTHSLAYFLEIGKQLPKFNKNITP